MTSFIHEIPGGFSIHRTSHLTAINNSDKRPSIVTQLDEIAKFAAYAAANAVWRTRQDVVRTSQREQRKNAEQYNFNHFNKS
jgi:hypothetical protein